MQTVFQRMIRILENGGAACCWRVFAAGLLLQNEQQLPTEDGGGQITSQASAIILG